MCGRYVTPDEAEIERAWRIGPRQARVPLVARYNVAPTTQVPIVRRCAGAAELTLEAARWGLIPMWWSQDALPKSTHNARIETASQTRSMWAAPLKTSRCIVPAQGWYEWKAVSVVDPGTGEISIIKQPHYIFGPGRPLLGFAGLMSTWKSPDQETITSCTIMTTDAAPALADVHDRMPIVLPASMHDAWLDLSLVDGAKALAIARDHAVQDFQHHPVSRRLSTRGADGADLLNPI